MALPVRHIRWLLPLVAALCVHAEPPPSHLTAAEELLRQVAPEQTSYKHKEPEVRWSTDVANPAYCHADCSGLIIALLEHCQPDRFNGDAFKRWLEARRPTARRFYDAIVAQKGFARVVKMEDVQPGDVIAVKYQPGGENTGHIMLVAEPPQRIEKETAPVVEGTVQWAISVIDETSSGHGAGDSRRGPDGKYRGGLGRGVFRVYAQADGAIVGYTWSTFGNSKYYGGEERGVAVGRLDPTFTP